MLLHAGGEGLAEVARSIGMEKNGVVHIGLYNPAELRFPGGRLEIRTQYPLEGRVSLPAVRAAAAGRIALFIPSYAADYHLKVNGSAVECRRVNGFAATTVPENGFVELEFGIPLLAEPGKLAASRERMTISHGFQMLGVSCEEECSIEPSALRMTEPAYTRAAALSCDRSPTAIVWMRLAWLRGNSKYCSVGAKEEPYEKDQDRFSCSGRRPFC